MGKNDYGKPLQHNPNFNGPIHNRSCTDVVWLILFIVFLGAWFFVGYHSMKNGSFEALLAPKDSYGNRCGVDDVVKDKKYLVYFDIMKCMTGIPLVGCSTPQMCVKECPKKTLLFERMVRPDDWESKIICNYNASKTLTDSTYDDYIKKQECTRYVIASEPVLNRCLKVELDDVQSLLSNMTKMGAIDGGKNPEDLIKKLKEFMNFDDIKARVVSDFKESQWYMVGALVIVVVLCFVYIMLLRWIVGPVIWASITCVFCFLGLVMYICYNKYKKYQDNSEAMNLTDPKTLLTNPNVWLGFLGAAGVVTLILLFIVIFLRARIVIAIALIQEGSKAVTAVKSTVFFPIFPTLLQLAVIAYTVVVFLLILSMGMPGFEIANLDADESCAGMEGCSTFKDGNACHPLEFMKCRQNDGQPCEQATCHFKGIEIRNYKNVYILLSVNVVGFVWMMFFLGGVGDMMLASTFATWYWTFHKRDLPFFTLTGGIVRVLRYHLGTVAFGSLIITIIAIIRRILEMIDSQMKKYDNVVARCILCFCKCCFWCLENIVKFINKNAFIMCAIHGKNFCRSARDAFKLIMRNILRVVVLDKVIGLIFFLSKLLLSIGTGVSVYFILESDVMSEVSDMKRLNYSYLPAIIIAVATYLISSLFFNVYAMAVNTLFLCFLEDCERNDGTAEKPYFMSKNLMSILGKKNKKD